MEQFPVKLYSTSPPGDIGMLRNDRQLDFEIARVLLVHDDPAARLTLQTVLEASGYRVDSAASAAEAVAKLDDQEYELVLSDLQMESPDLYTGIREP